MHRYTRAETRRIVGLEESQLRYWERLRLIRPRIRWRERFYSFGDLAALQTIRGITQHNVPAWRLHRALRAMEDHLGSGRTPLHSFRVFARGREVALTPPGSEAPPIEPLSGQFVFAFSPVATGERVRPIPSPSAEEWFEAAHSLLDDPASAAEAVLLYRRALQLQPDWVEARINLGVAYYHLGELDEAVGALSAAIRLAPDHPIGHFNIGCVLDERGATPLAIRHFRQALRAMPDHTDSHFNLAAAYEKAGHASRAQTHWRAYLRLDPSGDAANYARARLRQFQSPVTVRPLIPFPEKSNSRRP